MVERTLGCIWNELSRTELSIKPLVNRKWIFIEKLISYFCQIEKLGQTYFLEGITEVNIKKTFSKQSTVCSNSHSFRTFYVKDRNDRFLTS